MKHHLVVEVGEKLFDGRVAQTLTDDAESQNVTMALYCVRNASVRLEYRACHPHISRASSGEQNACFLHPIRKQ